MNRILNPFEYLSTGKALGWGLAGTLFSICLLTAVSWPVGDDLSKIVTILSSNLLLWIPLSLLLYVLALLFSPSRIRAVDIFATNLFAMLPTIVILGVLSVPSKWLGGLVCEPRSACEVMKLAGYNLIVILLSVSMAWSMVWGCFAYLVSANMKGWRGISIFVICYVFVSVVNQLLIAIRYAFFLPATQYDWILCRRQVCSLTFFHAAMEQKSGARGCVTRAPYNKKRVSSLYRTATTTYPCSIPRLGDSVGAGRIRLTRAQK